MKAITKFQLCLGKLKIPMACFKAVDNTTSIRASEVIKVNGHIYKVQRKPFYLNDEGKEVDVDKTQILKQYEKDNGEKALFTKDEQSQLLKAGSSKEWFANAVVDNNFNELDFQKEGIVAIVDLIKDKNLINQKHLKFFTMLKEGLNEKAIITKVLYKNVEYPVVISSLDQDKLLVRFLHYKDEIRDIKGHKLPELSEKEKEQATAFIQQFYNPDFKLDSFENETEQKVMKLINNRGTEVQEVETERLSDDENPFI